LPAAAVVAAVVVEPPVLAVVDLAHLPVLARRAHRVQLPLLARLPVLAKAHLPVVAHLVVEPEVPLPLLSRQSFSAARARSSP
jgi:hypothetical protein